MKLLNYTVPGEQGSQFGVVLDGFVMSFATLQERFNRHHPELSDMEAYLHGHPESETIASEICEMATEILTQFAPDDTRALNSVKILPPVPHPPALIDFALAPEHLLNSGSTLARHEKRWPVSALIRAVLKNDYRKNRHQTDFKCYNSRSA